MEVGTLKELGVEVGDVVVMGHDHDDKMTVVECPPRVGKYFHSEYELEGIVSGEGIYDGSGIWRIISRAKDKPKLWRDMAPEEKGALLLAAHEGKVIEVFGGNGWWSPCTVGRYQGSAYRIKPQPKVETVELYGRQDVQWVLERCKYDTHRITFQTIDGKPDCASIKMEAI